MDIFDSTTCAYDYPMWQTEAPKAGTSVDVQQCFHGSTNLPDGRQGLLVDPGAWSNLAGELWMQGMARKAIEAGLHVSETRMPKPLEVAGVGTGSNEAAWEIQVPIAVADSDGNMVLHTYKAPTVREGGKHLPALLGLQSMTKQNCVLEMAPGNEFLTMPGPGGYTVNWSPGTTRYRLERAPSGHLILPCDAFSKCQRTQGGLEEPMITFYGTQHKKETCEIGTQTEDIPEIPSSVTPKRKTHKTYVHTKD